MPRGRGGGSETKIGGELGNLRSGKKGADSERGAGNHGSVKYEWATSLLIKVRG